MGRAVAIGAQPFVQGELKAPHLKPVPADRLRVVARADNQVGFSHIRRMLSELTLLSTCRLGSYRYGRFRLGGLHFQIVLAVEFVLLGLVVAVLVGLARSVFVALVG